LSEVSIKAVKFGLLLQVDGRATFTLPEYFSLWWEEE